MRFAADPSRSAPGRMVAAILWIAILVVCGAARAQTASSGEHAEGHSPALINTCLVTADVKGLVKFYEAVLRVQAQWSGEDYAELHTGVGVLAIFSDRAQERYIPHSAMAGNNKGVVLEFKVDDVDQEFRRLRSVVRILVKPPTTQPWGTRSFYFRDPDGNLVDFFSRPGGR